MTERSMMSRDDVRVDVYRNAVPHYPGTVHPSTVRLTHIPTNTVVSAHGGLSEGENLKRAYEKLERRLYVLYNYSDMWNMP